MVNWDDALQKQLLLAVIHVEGVGGHNWDKVASLMGDGITASAVKQQFNKLKRDCKGAFGDAGGDAGDGATPKKTPAKRGRKAKGEEGEATKSTGKRKSKKTVSEDENEDDDESPTKKLKTETTEGGEEDEV